MRVFVKFLILISLVIIIFSLFNYVKRKNTLIEGNTVNANEENLQNQTDYLQERHSYYSNRIDTSGVDVGNSRINNWLEHKNGELTLKKGSNIKDLEIRNSLRTCSAITNCSLMETNPHCGYCHEEDKKDRFWDYDMSTDFNISSEPGTKVCNGEWTNKKEKCDKLVDREICDAVKDCGDLYGEASNKCGICPTTMKAYVVEKDDNGNIIKDENGMARKKYESDPLCKYDPNDESKTGLLISGNCNKFLKDNPCITPYREMGPHSSQCIEKMWKKSGCDYNKPDNKSIREYGNTLKDVDGVTDIKSYKSIGEFFEKIFEWTSSSDINNAIKYSNICFGEGNYTLDPCDAKFNGKYGGTNGGYSIISSICMKNTMLDEGCSINGSGYENTNGGKGDEHISNIIEAYPGFLPDMVSNKENYTNLIGKIIKIANGKGVYGFDRKLKILANKICYDKNYVDPQRNTKIKNGDTILMNVELDISFKNVKDPNGKTFDLTGDNIFKGVVINGDPGNDVPDENNIKVMWYMIINMKNINEDDLEDEKNIIMYRDDYLNDSRMHIDWQKQYFGNPLKVPEKFKLIPEFTDIKRDKTNFIECAKNWFPGCTETCEGAVSEAIKKYKLPLDQVIGNKDMYNGRGGASRPNWGIGENDWKPNKRWEGKEYYLCTNDGNVKLNKKGLLNKSTRVDCGVGKQSRIKEEIKPEKFGGNSYQSSHAKRFETVDCVNPKCPPAFLTNDENGIFYKDKKRWYKYNPNSGRKNGFGYFGDSEFKSVKTVFNKCDNNGKCVGVADVGKGVSTYKMIKRENNGNINPERGIYKKCMDLNYYKNNCDDNVFNSRQFK